MRAARKAIIGGGLVIQVSPQTQQKPMIPSEIEITPEMIAAGIAALPFIDPRTDRDEHEPFSQVSRGLLDRTEHAITLIIVQSASLPGAEDPG